MDKPQIKVGDISDVSGHVNIAAGNIVNNFQTILERSLTAVEQAKQARDLERQLLSEGVRAAVQSWQDQVRQKAGEGGPYKGLLAYHINETEIFFGREQETQDVLRCLNKDSLTILHAESGAGKSSLLQAGVEARLMNDAGHLAIHLRSNKDDPADVIKRAFLSDASQAPNLGQTPLREFLRQVGSILGQEFTLYIFLDQFEEFFIQLKKQERIPFWKSLAECLNESSLKVRWVIALRAEAFSNLAEAELFGITPFKNTYRLNCLNRAEARQAIDQPAKLHGITFEDGLIDAILDALESNRDIVPTQLQLVCSALTEELSLHQATIKHYQEQGGAEGILRDYLKHQLEQLPPADQEASWMVLRALITSEHQRAVRTHDELAKELRKSGVTRDQLNTVLARLIERRLIFTQTKQVETLELAHDYLVNEIQLDPHEQARKAAQELLDQEVRAYQHYKTLLTPERLAVIEPHEAELVFSRVAKTLFNESREARLKRERQRRFLVTGIISFALVVAIVMGVLGVWGQRNASTALARANELKALAIVAQANKLLADKNPDLALALALQATQGVQPPKTSYASLLDAAYISLSKGVYSVCAKDNHGTAWVTTVDISQDKKSAAIGCDYSSDNTSSIYVIDLPAGTVRSQWSYPAWLYKLSINPNGQSIIAGYSDDKAIIWSLEGKVVNTLVVHKSAVSVVAFTPDGSTALTASYDKTIALWDTSTGEELIHLAGSIKTDFPGKFTSAGFSPSGQKVVLGDDQGNVIVWDREMRLLYYPLEKHSNFVLHVEFSGETKIISSSADSTIAFWSLGDLLTRDNLIDVSKSYPGIWVNSVKYLPDDSKMLTALSNGLILLWDTRSMQVIQDMEGHQGEVDDLVISSDGTFALSGGRDGATRLWDLKSFSSGKSISGNTIETNSMVTTQNGSQLIGGSADGTVRIWDSKNTQMTDSWQAYSKNISISEIAIAPGGNSLLTAGNNGLVILWDLKSHKPIWQYARDGDAARSVDINSKGDLAIVGYVSGEIVQLDLKTGKSTCTMKEHTNAVNSVRFSPDGKTAVSGSNDYSIILWDISTCKMKKVLYKHNDWVLALKFSPDGKLLASASADGTIILWNLDTQQEMVRLHLPELDVNPGLDGYVLSLDFSADGQLLASGYANGNIAIWSATNGILLRKYVSIPADTCIYGVRCYWVLNTKFSPQGNALWASTSDGWIRSWPLIPASNPQEVRDWLAQNRYVRNLTDEEKAAYEIGQ